MSAAEANATLLTFNEKFMKMVSYSFFQKKNIGFQMTADQQGVSTKADVPTDEQVDAVLLTLRFFFVNNEGTGFVNIPKAYRALSLPDDLQSKFHLAYDKWKHWRSESSPMGGYTNAKFFEIMAYGSPIHRNDEAFYVVYDGWKNHFFFKDYSHARFCQAILTMTVCIQDVYDVNREVLAYLESQNAKDAGSPHPD